MADLLEQAWTARVPPAAWFTLDVDHTKVLSAAYLELASPLIDSYIEYGVARGILRRGIVDHLISIATQEDAKRLCPLFRRICPLLLTRLRRLPPYSPLRTTLGVDAGAILCTVLHWTLSRSSRGTEEHSLISSLLTEETMLLMLVAVSQDMQVQELCRTTLRLKPQLLSGLNEQWVRFGKAVTLGRLPPHDGVYDRGKALASIMLLLQVESSRGHATPASSFSSMLESHARILALAPADHYAHLIQCSLALLRHHDKKTHIREQLQSFFLAKLPRILGYLERARCASEQDGHPILAAMQSLLQQTSVASQFCHRIPTTTLLDCFCDALVLQGLCSRAHLSHLRLPSFLTLSSHAIEEPVCPHKVEELSRSVPQLLMDLERMVASAMHMDSAKLQLLLELGFTFEAQSYRFQRLVALHCIPVLAHCSFWGVSFDTPSCDAVLIDHVRMYRLVLQAIASPSVLDVLQMHGSLQLVLIELKRFCAFWLTRQRDPTLTLSSSEKALHVCFTHAFSTLLHAKTAFTRVACISTDGIALVGSVSAPGEAALQSLVKLCCGHSIGSISSQHTQIASELFKYSGDTSSIEAAVGGMMQQYTLMDLVLAVGGHALDVILVKITHPPQLAAVLQGILRSLLFLAPVVVAKMCAPLKQAASTRAAAHTVNMSEMVHRLLKGCALMQTAVENTLVNTFAPINNVECLQTLVFLQEEQRSRLATIRAITTQEHASAVVCSFFDAILSFSTGNEALFENIVHVKASACFKLQYAISRMDDKAIFKMVLEYLVSFLKRPGIKESQILLVGDVVAAGLLIGAAEQSSLRFCTAIVPEVMTKMSASLPSALGSALAHTTAFLLLHLCLFLSTGRGSTVLSTELTSFWTRLAHLLASLPRCAFTNSCTLAADDAVHTTYLATLLTTAAHFAVASPVQTALDGVGPAALAAAGPCSLSLYNLTQPSQREAALKAFID